MKYLVVLSLLFFYSFLHGQTDTEIEKFKDNLRDNSLADTTVLKNYENIIRHYAYSNVDSAKLYLNNLKVFVNKVNSNYGKYLYHEIRSVIPSLCEEKQTAKNTLLEFEKKIEYAEQLDDKKYLIKSYLNLGKLYSYQNDISKADSFALLGKKLAIKDNNWELLAHSYYLLGNINIDNQKNIRKSIQYFLMSDSICQKHNILNNERAVNLIELGNVFVALNEIDKAENYYKQSKKINETLQLEEIDIQLHLAFAEIDILRLDYPAAIEKINKAKSYFEKYGNLAYASENAIMLSYCYYKNLQYPEAFESLDYAKKVKTEIGDSMGILIVTNTQANYHFYWGKNPQACFDLAKEAKEMALKLGSLIDQELSLGLLHLSAAKLNEHQLAYSYKLEHEKIKDSIQGLGETSKAREIEEKYQSEKKEQKIIALETQKKLDDKEKANQQILLAGGIIISTLAGLFFFFLYRNRQKTNHKLKEMDSVKTKFFENISHEFRTPLTLIKLPISRAIQTQQTLSEDQLNLIHNNTSRLQNLIEDLLSLSELDSGKMIVNKTEQDPLLQARTLSSQFDSYAESKGITYSKSIENNSILATYDKTVVDKVLVNLISNAIKYSDKGGEVNVSISIKNQLLEIKVTDTGGGISKENQEKIFDRFYQIGEKDESKQGSGIGLALVKKVLELNKGTISVISKENEGSTFISHLPLKKITPITDEKVIESNTNENFKTIENQDLMEEIVLSSKPSLLIAEDSLELLNYISDLFSEDFEIFTATNGIEGKELALKQVPDIVISDWMMPKMNGIEFLNEIKTNPVTSHIPFLLLTAKTDVEDKIKGYETGADAYFSKPFNYEELKAQINNLIAQRKVLLEKFGDSTNENLEAPMKNSRDIAFWENLKSHIKSNLAQPEELTSERVSESFSMSRMQLHRKLMALTGQGLGALVKNQKMNYAAKLLKDPAMRVSDVCFEVGYSDNSAFARAFKQEIGLTPSQFKAQFKK